MLFLKTLEVVLGLAVGLCLSILFVVGLLFVVVWLYDEWEHNGWKWRHKIRKFFT
jgi:hypothetical protein